MFFFVLGDGYCWLYSFLVPHNVLLQPHQMPPEDHEVVRVVMTYVQEEIKNNGACTWLTDEEYDKVSLSHT